MFLVVVLIGILALFLSACNRQIIDMTFKFDKAVVYSPNGDVLAEGKVQSWNDFENGDEIQVKIDGKTYLTHYSNVILIAN